MNVLITLTSAGVDTGPFNLYSNVDTYTTAFETNISRGILFAGYTSTIVPPGTTSIRVKSMGVCKNYVDLVLYTPSTTTTTTTSNATSTTTSTTSTAYVPPGESTTTTTTTAYVPPGASTTTSTTTTAYVPPGGSTTTTTSSTTTTAYVGPATTTTTSTSTSTSTTSTSTTSIIFSCQQWRNDTVGEVTITYTPCGSSTPVSNYALADTSSVCAVYGSVTVTAGGALTLVGSCSAPGTTTTTTTIPATTTTTTTGLAGSTTTTTSTSSTTTTNIFNTCQQWRNDTSFEATVTYTPCGSSTPVSNYALADTSSICAKYGSVTVTVGGPLTEVGPCV